MPSLVALMVSCGLTAHADVLAAIVRVESGGNPIALAVNGGFGLVREPRTLEEALATARWLLEHGYSFDAGLGQVNSANLRRLGLDVGSVFLPCANLKAASQILEECFDRARGRWREEERIRSAALSCYNTGHLGRGIANGYVEAVRAASMGLARGLGASALWKSRPGALPVVRKPKARALAVASGAESQSVSTPEAFAAPRGDVFGAAFHEEGLP